MAPSRKAVIIVQVEPAQELLRLAPASGRHAQRDVTAPEAVERTIRGDHGLEPGLLEVLAPGARGVDAVEVAHHLPVVEARVADLQLALTRTRCSRPPRRRRSQLIPARAARGGIRPRTRASWPPPRPGSGLSSSLAFAACARPHTISKNASVLSAGRVCQTARARRGPGFHIECGVLAGTSRVSPARTLCSMPAICARNSPSSTSKCSSW